MPEFLRYDQVNLDELKLKETGEGFLEGYAIATRVGVFTYRKSDGSLQREFRSPEEVFNKDSIDSFKMVPITNGHPSEMVTADNAKDLAIGMTGQKIKKIDEKYMAPFVKITDKDAVSNAKNKSKTGLSWGYKVDLVKKDGIYNGERYDYIQTKIRGNHLAIVHEGRAGSQAKLRMDEEDAVCVLNNNFNNNLNMKKIKLDGKDFEVSEEVAARVDSLEAENSVLKNKEKELSTKVDTLQGSHDALKTKLDEEMKKDHSTEVEEKVKARIALIEKASDFIKKDEDISSLSDRDVQVKAITNVCSDFKADGKSDEYISARFDTICDFRKDKNLSESIKIASNKNDSSEASIGTSNSELQANLINRSKKGE